MKKPIRAEFQRRQRKASKKVAGSGPVVAGATIDVEAVVGGTGMDGGATGGSCDLP
ncbi:MAG: hypothetical protein P1U90_20370 [Akkermansiaceae bacterium]|nr:hypothetical protein [Akkermansiaceae bacterium]